MKKLLILIFSMASLYTTHAQVQFGIKAGGNRTNFIYSGTGLVISGPEQILMQEFLPPFHCVNIFSCNPN